MNDKNFYGDLKTDVLDQAEVYPYIEGKYGVYFNGSILSDSLTKRHGTQSTFNEVVSNKKTNLHLDKAIYGGLLLTHYGHFVFESLSRLWYTRIDKDSPIIFCSKQKEIKKYQKEIFDILGIKNHVIIAKEPIAVNELTMPTPGARIRDYLSEHHESFLACCPYVEENATRCIWLSRSSLKRFVHKVNNEDELEKALKKIGWEIFNPQDFSVAEQVQILSESKRIAGFVGSAFHTLLLIKNFSGQVIIFQRNPHNGNKRKISETYHTIANTKKINQTVIRPDIEFINQKQSFIRDISTIINVLK